MNQMHIHFSPVWCTLQRPTPENDPSWPDIERDLNEELSFRPTGFFFSPKYQSRVWDGYTRLYHLKTGRFRVGMLPRIKEFFEKRKIDTTVEGFPVPGVFVPQSKNYTLRAYQTKAGESIVQHRYGILQAPVRAGKTIMFISVIDSERQFPAVFFCRSLDLAYQTIERIETMLPDVSVGLVGNGKTDIREVTVVTIQSAFSAYNKKCLEKGLPQEKEAENKAAIRNLLTTAKIVFYDEVHHVQSTTSRFILDHCVHATMKIGLSATPFSGKPEDMKVEEVLGPVFHRVSYSELIKEGFLLRPYIYMYTLPLLDIDEAYPRVYKKAVVDNDFLTGLIVKLVQSLTAMGKSVVVQVEFINHAKKLSKALKSPMLTGQEKNMDIRVEVKKKLEAKEIMCLVSTLFEEGLDVPSLDFTINAAGGLSSIATLQRMRSITANEGKASCGIIDFYHQCKYLEEHSQARYHDYTAEPEFVVEERDVSEMSLEEIE